MSRGRPVGKRNIAKVCKANKSELSIVHASILQKVRTRLSQSYMAYFGGKNYVTKRHIVSFEEPCQSVRLEAPRPKAALRTQGLDALIPETGNCVPLVAICRVLRTKLVCSILQPFAEACWPGTVETCKDQHKAEAIITTHWT